MLTIYPNSELYREIQHGNWKEESELEKYKEVRTLVDKFRLAISSSFSVFKTNGFAPVRKVLLYVNPFQNLTVLAVSFKSASISAIGDILNLNGKSAYSVQNLQLWCVQPAVTSKSNEDAS